MYVFMENWRNLMDISIRKPRGIGDEEILRYCKTEDLTVYINPFT